MVDLYGVAFDLAYNNSVAYPKTIGLVIDSEKGNWLNGGDPSKDSLTVNDLTGGNLYCAHTLLGDESVVSGSDTLFYIKFNRFSIGDLNLSTSNELIESSSGTITVTEELIEPTSTTSTSTTSTSTTSTSTT